MSCYNSLLLEAEPGTSHASILLAGGDLQLTSHSPFALGDGVHHTLPCNVNVLPSFCSHWRKNLCFWWITLIHFRHVPLDEMHDCVEDEKISFCLSDGKFVVLKLIVLWWHYPSTIRHHCKDEWHLCAHSHSAQCKVGVSNLWGWLFWTLVPFCWGFSAFLLPLTVPTVTGTLKVYSCFF